VPIGADHADEVRAVAAKQKPEGRPNLVSAVFAALAELSEPPYSDDPMSHKRVIVFAAGVDRCARDPAGELEHLLRGSGINRAKGEFKLFGLSASEREERQLNAVKAALERPGLQGPEPPSIPDEE